MISIVDYGMGNLRSVQKAFEKAGYSAEITSSIQDIRESSGVVLPGVGAFGDAMVSLEDSGIGDALRDYAASGRPLLGVCLGQQLLFTESQETFEGTETVKGLGVIPGKVLRFEVEHLGLKVPQIGWNSIRKTANEGIFTGIPDKTYFYFVHSYYVVPDDLGVVSTWSDYGIEFPSAICKGNLFAAQFHPEKSSEMGLELYRNFGRLVEKCS